jgi:multidrug efflux pump subunit AcrA (membrane-fusion protein)
MNLKNMARFMAVLSVAVISAAANAQLQLECQTDINVLYLLKDSNSLDQTIYGVKVRDWKKEYLDQVLANAEACVEKRWGSSDPTGKTTKMMINDLKVNAYPRWFRHIDERDRNLQKELAVVAIAQKAAEDLQHENEVRQQRELEAQKQVEQAKRNVDAENEVRQQREIEAGQQQVEQAKRNADAENEVRQQREIAARQQQVEQTKRNAEAETERRAEVKKSNNLWILGIIIAVAFSGWFWNKFIRNRCPSCKSTGYNTVNVTETDRFRGTKEVTEMHSRGTNTRHVQVTYVHKLYHFKCKACQHEWEKERREELGGNLILTRIRSGFF